MATTNLTELRGSVVLCVPTEIVEKLQLRPGAAVGVSVEGGRLIVDPKPRPHYTLAELLAESDYSRPLSPEEREWIDAPCVGGELI